MDVRCCWCGKHFIKIANHYWCETEECRVRQASQAMVAEPTNGGPPEFMNVPLPKQVEFGSCVARYMLGGGAAGSTKSHEARWGMYGRCLAIPDYEGLLLRRTWDEINKHHFRLMEREARIFQRYGYDVTFSITNREMRFNDTGSVIEGGHMEDEDDVEKYLSRERDEIVADEGSTFPPRSLISLSTRARTTKPQVLATGSRGRFRVYTNPGGPASNILRDLFIDHSPNWDDFPPEFREGYDPSEWVYIPGNLEDNPYLPASYERDLMVLQPWRFKQLRYNDWDAMAGIFFDDFDKNVHVKDLGMMSGDFEWFRSMDWGYINPGCVLWWCCLPDGRYYIRHEWKFSHQTVANVKKEIIDKSLDWGIPRVRYTVADPAVKAKFGDTGESIQETFQRSPHNVPLMLGDNNRVAGWQRVREMLRVREDGHPTIIAHPSCSYLIRSLAQATSAKNNPEDVDTNTDDHALDTLRYGAMSRPSPTKRSTTSSTKTFRAQQQRIVQYRRMMSRR